MRALSFTLFIFVTSLTYGASQPFVLSQKEVTRLVIEKSSKAKENTLKYQLLRLAAVQKLAAYDWMFGAESGYERDRNESPTHPSTLTNQTYKTSLKLKKSLITGTNLSFDYSRNSLYGNDVSVSNPKITQYTYDLLGFSVEQNLWKNAFGMEDRAGLETAELTYQASTMGRASELQDLVLESLRLYWNTYVAQENFSEALASRDRYQRFVGELRRKTAYGYSNSYELYQIQAELESREQLIKTTSYEYLKNSEALAQLLNLPKDTRIEFPKIEAIPDLPSINKKNLAESRTLQSQALKIKAAEAALTASRSSSRPVLSVNGSVSRSGYAETPALAESHLMSGTYPRYYVGLKFMVQFGSDYGTHDLFNKKVSLELEQQRYQRTIEELKNNITSSERKIQSSFFAVSSTKKQVELREKTLNEMQRSFNNGRIDISLLIEAMNKYFTARVQHTRSTGDYFIALNEWAALNDELIQNLEVKP